MNNKKHFYYSNEQKRERDHKMRITTKLTLCDDPTIASFEQAILNTLTPDTKSLLILASESDSWCSEEVDALLTNLKIPILGGVFPFIIFEGNQLSNGTLIIGLNVSTNVFVVENLSHGKCNIESQLEILSPQIASERHLMTIVDGLTSNIQRFTEGLYEITGYHSVSFGGGAGTLDFVQKPCLFTNQGMLFDAAIIAAIPTPFRLEVSHGWEIAAGPFLVTRSEGNVLEKLDYKPALDVYQTHVVKNTEQPFDLSSFYDIAKGYPLGIENLEGDILVRAPLSEDKKSLICLGEIPENSIVYLLKGVRKNLIAASGESAKLAYKANKSTHENDTSVVVFDCISRPLFLGDDFCKELSIIKENVNNHSHIFGALSIGEIGSSNNGPIDWLNKSTAIAVF